MLFCKSVSISLILPPPAKPKSRTMSSRRSGYQSPERARISPKQCGTMSRPSTKGYFVKDRLVEAREALGITQQELAELLGKSDSTISNWERGHQSPEPSSLQRLSDVLKIPTQYFLRNVPNYGSCAIFF